MGKSTEPKETTDFLGLGRQYGWSVNVKIGNYWNFRENYLWG
jgi:hypothetical protein